MADSRDGDPFKWDVDQVVQELCGEPRPWTPSQPSKRLDAVALAHNLRQAQIDGEDLLSWEDHLSLDVLCRDLGISKPAQKMTLAKAVAHLKKRSPAYHKAKADAAKDQDPDSISDDNNDVQMHDGLGASANNEPTQPQQETGTYQPLSSQNVFQFSGARQTEQLQQQPQGQGQQPEAEPPKKKKRLAPQLVSTEVSHVGRLPLPTAADSVTITSKHTPDVSQGHIGLAYLGPGTLVQSHLIPRTSLVPTRSDDPLDEARSFAWAFPEPIPPGRRLQIHRRLRNLLRSNSNSEMLIRANISPLVEPEPSVGSSEDELLPYFGDSDNEDKGYDSETLREMMEDEDELRAEPGILVPERVGAILDDVVVQLRNKWREKKLPKLTREAYRLWNQARRSGRDMEILKTSKRVAELGARLSKIRTEIMRQDWTSDKPLRLQARSLDATIEDHCYFSWLYEMLRGREPPRFKSVSASRPRPRPNRSARVVELSDEEGQLILSDSDSSGDDFVVDDPTDDSMDNAPSNPPGDLAYSANGLELVTAGSMLDTDDTMPLDEPVPERDSPSPENFIDLTGIDFDSGSSQDPPKDPGYVDLVTPEKAGSKISPSSSPADYTLFRDQLELPFDQPEEIAEIHPKSWEHYNDGRRLAICVLWNRGKTWRNQLFELVKSEDPDEIWDSFILPACQNKSSRSSPGPGLPDLSVSLARLFWQYATSQLSAGPFYKVLGNKIKASLPSKRSEFDGFLEFLRQHVIPHFPAAPGSDDTPMRDDDGEDSEESGDSEEDIDATPSKTRKQKRRIARDQVAQQQRDEETTRSALNHERSTALLNRVANDSTISSADARLIVNTSKEGDDNTGFIYVSRGRIAGSIRDHQIDGVRFMWDQIMANQGCLLAHTMGLGKTMQVITLLVAFAEAGSSQDPAVRSQVPEDLKKPMVLVLCPSGLVENWVDEFAKWSPPDAFNKDANIFYVDRLSSWEGRRQLVASWKAERGIFIVGYEMFKILIQDEELSRILIEEPGIVVADEAHRMKNQSSQLGQASVRFTTQRRLALTGSPLANKVEEFYSMIDWAAPNFLGPSKEFKAVFVDPIQKGLWGSSTNHQYRKAKKVLAALERTVSPKTHRLTIKALKGELPDKKEFVLTQPLTELQSKLYDMYLQSVKEQASEIKQAQTFSVMSNLTLVCNHPRCFQQKLQRQRDVLDGRAAAASEEEGDGLDATLSRNFVAAGLKLLKRDRDINSIEHSWKVKHLVTILDECRARKEKVLVFSQSIPTLDFLDNLLRQQSRRLAKLTGSTESSSRQNIVKDFNQSDCEVFLISTNAGGIGLNISGASRVVIFDFKHNPVSEQQAVGRAYRIGQTKPVFVYRFVTGGTFEATLHNKAVFKMQLASRVVDKENPKRWSSKPGEFLKPYEEPPQESVVEFSQADEVLAKLLPPLGSGVRSIVLTDTFEEEDPNDVELNPEERKEVENLTEMQRLRHTDPERYRMLENELNQLQYAQQMRALQPGHAALATGYNSYNPPQQSHYGHQAQMPVYQQGQPQAPVFREQRLGQDAGQPTESATANPPMTAAGANAYNVPWQGGADTSLQAAPNGPSLQTNDAIAGLVHSLEESLVKAAVTNNVPAELRSPEHVRKTISQVAEIRTQRRAGFLPDKHHWGKLKKLVENDTRFAAAYYNGLLTVDELADENVDKRAHEMSRMPSAEFQERLGQGRNRQNDPDHLHNALQRSNRQSTNPEGTRPSPRAKEDLKVLREVADRRKRRFPKKLPSWASKAVDDGR